MSSVNAYRSEDPPFNPENAIRVPSGDQVGVNISSTSGTGISRATLPPGMSNTISIATPSRTVAKANCFPVRSQPPADSMN